MKITTCSRRIAALAVAGTLLLGSAPAGASTPSSSYVFEGGGFGHGAGLSQWGAYGMARQGSHYQAILRHYYTGIGFARLAQPDTIRVGLMQGLGTVGFSGDGRFDVVAGGQVLQGTSGQGWNASLRGDGAIDVFRDGTLVAGGVAGTIFVTFDVYGTIMSLPQAGHRYRYGGLAIEAYTNGARSLRAILTVPIEKYMYGLGEVPSSWPAEALKTQAVAGRSYAIAKINANPNQDRPVCNCAVYATTSDQVYVGYDKEAAAFGSAWKAAVDATAQEVGVYNGQVITAYYSSSSGGHTEHSENVFSATVPYLRGVSDPADLQFSPYGRWRMEMTREHLSSRLGSHPDTNVGSLISMTILEPRGVSGRVLRVVDSDRGGLRIVGTAGVKRVSGDRLRSVLGLRSTLFSIWTRGVHKSGNFIKGSSPAVYLIDGNELRVAPSGEFFLSRANWPDIIPVTDDEIVSYPAASIAQRDGTLLRETGTSTVFVLEKGIRRAISSGEVFVASGYRWEAVRDVPSEEITLTPLGAPYSGSATHLPGTFVQDGATVYRIEGTTKRWVPSPAALDSYLGGFTDDREVVPASPSDLALPDGPPLPPRNGSLIGAPNGAVYLVSGGARLWFPSAERFTGLGFSWDGIVAHSQADVDRIPSAGEVGTRLPMDTFVRSTRSLTFTIGAQGRRRSAFWPSVISSLAVGNEVATTSSANLASYLPATSAMLPREGALISDPGGAVFVVSGGKRYGFTSAELFLGLGYRFDAVRRVGGSEIALVPYAGTVASGRHRDGTLISNGGAVFMIDAGARRWVPAGAFVDSYLSGFGDWREVVPANASDMSLPEAAPMPPRDGALVGAPSGAVYLISQGKRWLFTSGDQFLAMGYGWTRVRWISDREMAFIPFAGNL